jgi:hypothetical protein
MGAHGYKWRQRQHLIPAALQRPFSDCAEKGSHLMGSRPHVETNYALPKHHVGTQLVSSNALASPSFSAQSEKEGRGG